MRHWTRDYDRVYRFLAKKVSEWRGFLTPERIGISLFFCTTFVVNRRPRGIDCSHPVAGLVVSKSVFAGVLRLLSGEP